MRVSLKIFLFFFFFYFFTLQNAFSQGQPPAKVVVSKVVRETVQDQIRLIGTVDPWRRSRVATEVAGKVDSLVARRGMPVQKGKILATLGRTDLLLELKETQARKNSATVRLENAEDELKTAKRLIKNNLVSRRAYKEKKFLVRELKEDLAVIAAERLQLEDLLSKKEVKAPFTGTITQELTEEGEWVEKGTGIVFLVDLSKVRILAELPEKYVALIQPQSPAIISFDALPGEMFRGTVHALIPEGDRLSRIFPLEVHVANPHLKIKEGMLARVSFEAGLSRRVLMVTQDAILRKGPQISLFVVKDGKAVKALVTTGKTKKNMIEITGSLKENDVVVIRGNERLRNGQSVQVVP